MVPWRGRPVQPGLSRCLHKQLPAVCCKYMTGDVTVLKYLEWSEPADPPCPDRGRPPSLRRPDHFISPLTLPSLLSALHIDLPTHFPPAGIFAPLGGQSSPRQSNDQPHTRMQRPPLDWQPNYPAWERASHSAVPQLTGSEGRLSSSPSRSTPLCIFLPVSAVCLCVCVQRRGSALDLFQRWRPINERVEGTARGLGVQIKRSRESEGGIAFSRSEENKPPVSRWTRITDGVCDGENAFFNSELRVQSHWAGTPRLNVRADVPLRLSTLWNKIMLQVFLVHWRWKVLVESALEQLRWSEVIRSLRGDKKSAACQLALFTDLHTSHFKESVLSYTSTPSVL